MKKSDRKQWLASLQPGDAVAINDYRICRIRSISQTGWINVDNTWYFKPDGTLPDSSYVLGPVTDKIRDSVMQGDLYYKIKELWANSRCGDYSLKKLHEIAKIMGVE